MKAVYQQIATVLGAIKNCQKTGNSEWETRHIERLERIAKDYLPHGGGFDNGIKVDLEASQIDDIVLVVPFHPMDEWGGYEEWVTYIVHVIPSLQFGFYLTAEDEQIRLLAIRHRYRQSRTAC